MTYLVAFLALGTGAMISVICGFGIGVFAMMFLPHVMSSTMASSAVCSIVSIVQSAIICWTLRNRLHWKDIIYPAIAYFVMSTICVTYGKRLSNDSLKLALGIFLILLSIYFIFIAKGVSLKHNLKNGLIAGGLGGIMSSLFGAGGPPASLYFSSAYLHKEEYLANIQLFFLCTGIYITFIRAVNGIITKEVLLSAAAGLAGMMIGTLIGKKIFDRINADTMRKAIYALMALSGIILIAGSLK